MGGKGGPHISFLIGILLYMLLGSPCRSLESWNIFENRPFSGQNRVNWGGGAHWALELKYVILKD